MTARPEILIHGREVRANTQAAPRTNLAKVFNCDATHQVHGRAITGEASEYLKKTLMRDMFVMACRAVKSRETMSLSVKNTASWALKVPLEEMCRFIWPPFAKVFTCDATLGCTGWLRCFLRHPDNHQRHVSGRRLRAYHSVKDLLEMTLISRWRHNMIPLSVIIRKHAVSLCAEAAAKSKLFRFGYLRLCHLSDCLPVPTKPPECDCP